MIYLDHNATTPLAESVLEAMIPYLTDSFGNPSSYYQLGRTARAAIDQARESAADVLGAQAEEIVFTGGGTESDNLALRGVIRALGRGRGHVVTSAMEHHAVLRTAEALRREGVEVTFVPPDAHGRVEPEAVERVLRPDTALVSIMAANNETGVIQPIRDIARVTRRSGVLLHTDAVQAVGKIPVDVDEWDVDLLTCSAHKICGPKGTGLLYVRRGTPLVPVTTGGHHEHELRAGTENVAGIVGMGAALREAAAHLADPEGAVQRMGALRDRLEQGARKIGGVTVHGAGVPRVANTSYLSFRGVDGESVVLHLDLRGICAATGSACTTGETEPSHVLMAMRVDPRIAQGAVRFSLGMDTTVEDVDATVAALSEIVARLREVSSVV